MTGWTDAELSLFASTPQVGISSLRPDGTLTPPVTIWIVRVGDDLYVRSAYGARNPWFRRAVASGRGAISTGKVRRDVVLEQLPVSAAAHEVIAAAYRRKYAAYAPAIIASVASGFAAQATLRVVPA